MRHRRTFLCRLYVHSLTDTTTCLSLYTIAMNPVALNNSTDEIAAYLRTLPAIRERCGRVHALAKEGKLEYFDYHAEKEADAAAFCVDIMKACLLVACSLHTLTPTPTA